MGQEGRNKRDRERESESESERESERGRERGRGGERRVGLRKEWNAGAK